MPKVSVIGAGAVGAEVARRTLERKLADVVLVDILEGIPQGKALDLKQAGAIEGYDNLILGTNNYSDIRDADIVVLTAGLARKPGMSRDDLLLKNAEIVKSITLEIVKFAPMSKIIVVTNPLDVMAYLVWKVSGFEANRIMGMAGLLDSARMSAFVAEELRVPITEVSSMVLGSHGDLMVPIPRYTTVSGKPVTEWLSKEKLNKIIERTRNGGAEIVSLLKTGSAYYAPSAAVTDMIEAILRDRKKTIPSSVYLAGQYGIKDIFIGVPAKLGSKGVEEIIELTLSPEESKSLRASAESVRENVRKLKL